MMEENKSIEKRVDAIADEPVFRGYTLEEIRYQRALAALRREYSKERITAGIRSLRKRAVPGGKEGMMGRAGTVAQKLFSSLNYIDYAMMGYTAFSAIKRVFKVFRRNKK